MKARCKFTVTKVQNLDWNDYPEKEVTLHTMYDSNDPEDTKFSRYTPVGQMSFNVSNPNVLDMFVEGRAFYVDLIPVEEE